MSELKPFTPRSNPGKVPSEHTAQTCPLDNLTKLSAFISDTPTMTLYSIMSTASEAELRALLSTAITADPRIRPTLKMTITCGRIFRSQREHGQLVEASRDVVPYALFLFLKFRVIDQQERAWHKFEDHVNLSSTFKTAYENTCDY